MPEMGVIVCATRGGEASRLLQTRAVEIARQRQDDLVFVYVVNPKSVFEVDDGLLPAISQEMTWFANAILDIARQRGRQAGVKVETIVRRGEVETEIARVLNEFEADLLVIGSPRLQASRQLDEGRVQSFAHRITEKTGVAVQIIQQASASET